LAGSGGNAAGASGTSAQCSGGKTSCWGACSDLQSDPNHCGKCEVVCASGTCNAGVCKKAKDCFTKTVVKSPKVADFEGYDGSLPVANWGWAFNAPSGSAGAVYAGLYEYDDGTNSGSPNMSIVGPGNASSKYAASLATTSQATKSGAGIGLWMGCVDASSYQGLSFWVKGNAPAKSVTLTLASEATSPPDQTDAAGGGTCTSGTCKGASVDFPVTTTWSQVLVKWSAFAPGTANGSTVATTGDDINGMGWYVPLAYAPGVGDAGYVPVASAYDFSVDDIQFFGSTPCSGSLQLCGVACADTSTDNANCGSCGKACTTGRTCVSGSCACPTGYTDCNGQCVDPNIDAQNCGGCGKACTGQCSGGTCAASACVANMPQKDKTGTSGDSIVLGKYWVSNNQWGNKNASGTQSIWDTCSSGNTIGWGTDWSWSGGSGVISYASTVLGWQYGFKVSNSGLPVQLSAGKTITCGWTYRVTPGQTMNVSYDLFAHTQSNPSATDSPSDEIMIWLYKVGAAPIGDAKATVTIAGTAWDLYQGSNGNWNVYSYVRQSNAETGATLNISDFLADLTAKRGLDKAKYLSSIQAGTEVTSGTGHLDTDQYYCTIQ
jgi:hypothetical protein